MGEKGAVVVAIAVGYVLVPPLARAWPPLVNGFLFLILFGSILNRQDVWLPILESLGKTTNKATGAKASTLNGSPVVNEYTGFTTGTYARRLPALKPE